MKQAMLQGQAEVLSTAALLDSSSLLQCSSGAWRGMLSSDAVAVRTCTSQHAACRCTGNQTVHRQHT